MRHDPNPAAAAPRIETHTIKKSTQGQGDMLDLTPDVAAVLKTAGLREGSVTVFAVGSTAGVTTIEFEPGLVKDMKDVWQKIAPFGPDYHHHGTWGDDNGSAHVRAALLGPSLTVPFKDGALLLGRWQQIVLMEFDTRPRERTVVVQGWGV